MKIKSLTKKNCVELGIEYIGANTKEGGVNYKYRGCLFIQYKPRYDVKVTLDLDFVSFPSMAAKEIFWELLDRQAGEDSSVTFIGEIESDDLKAKLDAIADKVEQAIAISETGHSEQQKQDFVNSITQEIDNICETIDTVKKTYRWWECAYDTNSLITKIDQVLTAIEKVRRLLCSYCKESIAIEQNKLKAHITEEVRKIRWEFKYLTDNAQSHTH